MNFQDGLYLRNNGTMCPGVTIVCLFGLLLENPFEGPVCGSAGEEWDVLFRLTDYSIDHVVALHGKANCSEARNNVAALEISNILI